MRPDETPSTGLLNDIYTLFSIAAVGMVCYMLSRQLGLDLRIKAYIDRWEDEARQMATARRLIEEALGDER